ncbi:MAG: ankyrin repeat domain-containing protein [Pseudomonadota bacterium]
MNKKLRELLDKVRSAADFGYVDFHSINDTNALGDNALHCVCVWGDIDAAKLLIESGIEVNQHGEGGFTPLNIALNNRGQTTVKLSVREAHATRAMPQASRVCLSTPLPRRATQPGAE